MDQITIERLTRAEAEARKAEILGEFRMTPETLRRRAARYDLNPRQRALAVEYEGQHA